MPNLRNSWWFQTIFPLLRCGCGRFWFGQLYRYYLYGTGGNEILFSEIPVVICSTSSFYQKNHSTQTDSCLWFWQDGDIDFASDSHLITLMRIVGSKTEEKLFYHNISNIWCTEIVSYDIKKKFADILYESSRSIWLQNEGMIFRVNMCWQKISCNTTSMELGDLRKDKNQTFMDQMFKRTN